MVALKDVAIPRVAFDRRIVIYLEGKDDVEVFKYRWFAEETNIDFRPAGGGQNEGGSARVIQRVNETKPKLASGAIAEDEPNELAAFDPSAMPDDAPAFGLVDRDALYFHAQCVDLFFEPDDEVFQRRCAKEEPLGPNIRPLVRWEIESYLVAHVRAICDVLNDLDFNHRYNVTTMGETLLRDGWALIPIIAANFVLHARKVAALAEKFGVHHRTRNAIEDDVHEHLSNKFSSDPSWSNEFSAHVAALERFDPPSASGSDASRWERLCRIIDGKRMLARLNHRYEHPQLRGLLARAIKSLGLIDKEFREHIAYFQQLAERRAVPDQSAPFSASV